MKKNDSTAHYIIATAIDNCPPSSQPGAYALGTMTKKRNEGKRDKMKIRVGNFVTVKDGEIDGKIREGKCRNPFHSRPFSLLVVSACLLHGVQMVNYC